MNFNNIIALKPRVLHNKPNNYKTYPLELSSRFSANQMNNIYKNKFKNILRNTMKNTINSNKNHDITFIYNNPNHNESIIHKYQEILPTIQWELTHNIIPNKIPEIQINIHEQPHEHIENIGFIILRHVNSSITNEYWKECYRCIKKNYPTNRILIIDDNIHSGTDFYKIFMIIVIINMYQIFLFIIQ